MNEHRVGFPAKLAYWVGQLAEGLKAATFNLFLLFFYNQVLGLSGTLCGIALIIGTVVDAVTDPMMGSVSDGWRSRWGRRHPFMYIAAVPLALSLYLTFNPLVETQAALFVWLLICSVLTRVAMTLYSVPHMALGAEMSSDYQERTVIVAGRSFFGLCGHLLVFALGFGLFFAASAEFENGQLNPAAYPPFALAIATLTFVSVVGTAWGTHHLIPSLIQPPKQQHNMLKQTVLDTLEALQNLSFRWLVMGFVVMSVPLGVGNAFTLYMNTFFWQLPPSAMVYILVGLPVGTMLGFLFAPFLGRFLEKRQSLILGATGWVVFSVAPVCLHYAGWFPAPGSQGVVIALVICTFMAGLLVSQVGVGVGSMLADVAAEQALSSHKRQEGAFYGAYTFVVKATMGVGGAVSGFALDLIDWPRGEMVKTAADVPPETLFYLAMIAGPGLAVGFLPAVWCFMKYRLDRSTHHSILAELDSRRQAGNSATVTRPTVR